MKKTALSFLLGVASVASVATMSAALSGCDSKTSANEKNFAVTVSQYLDKKGEQCLDPVTWPVDVYEVDVRQQKLYPDNAAGQMAALEAAGLAKGEDAMSSGVKVRRYTMLDAAKPYLRANPGKKPRLCWGRKSLSKVLHWDDPRTVGDHEESSVIYTYKLSNVADWARKPQVKEGFPELGRTIDGERGQKEKLYVKLTPQGWQAFGLND